MTKLYATLGEVNDKGYISTIYRKGIDNSLIQVHSCGSKTRQYCIQDSGVKLFAPKFPTDYNNSVSIYNRQFGEGNWEIEWVNSREEILNKSN